jgi:CheY-like chemotaxis protein
LVASVLLVDDEADGCEAVERYLAKCGHVVERVPNGREALSALANRTPHVLVLDLRMPEMDGVSFLEVIRCYLRWSLLPVIVLTALQPDHPTVARAKHLGAKKVYYKGDIVLADLAATISKLAGMPAAATG